MRIIRGLENVPVMCRPVVTVGSFDGVHRGHRELLAYVANRARSMGGESVVVTFSPHPRQVLGAEPLALLNTVEEKAVLLEEIGIDNMVVVAFDEAFSRLTSSQFIGRYLVEGLGMQVLVVGYNHRFGHDRQGDVEALRAMGDKMGFEVEKMPQLMLGGRKVSSTEVRRIIVSGDMTLAAEYLARGYVAIGDVDEGRVTVGEKDKLMPCDGVYDVEVDGKRLRLTVAGGEFVLSDGSIGGHKRIEFV